MADEPMVIVQCTGGVMELIEKTPGVVVELRDYDNAEGVEEKDFKDSDIELDKDGEPMQVCRYSAEEVVDAESVMDEAEAAQPPPATPEAVDPLPLFSGLKEESDGD